MEVCLTWNTGNACIRAAGLSGFADIIQIGLWMMTMWQFATVIKARPKQK